MKTNASFLFLLCALGVLAFLPSGVGESTTKDHTNLSQAEQNQRAYDEFKRVDALLTKIFEERLKAEGLPASREALIASQRAWTGFRDADGHYESVSGEDGSARTYYVNQRMTYLTKQRIYQPNTPFAAGWIERATATVK